MSSFYVHIESNSSFSHFQDNTISSFRNWLCSPIILEPNSYEVALVECAYPSTPIRFGKGDELYKVLIKSNDINSPVNENKTIYNNIVSLDLFKNNTYSEYKTQDEWITVCNNTNIETFDDLLEAMSTKDFLFKHYNGYTLLSTRTVEEDVVYDFQFNTQMANILGFPHQIHCNSSLQADYKFNFKSNNSRYYIYCDIVENQHVGDTTAPILRSLVNPYTDIDKIVSKTFNNLQYVSVAKPSMDYIHMYIRNEFGEPPPFSFGSFSATLHFRRKRF